MNAPLTFAEAVRLKASLGLQWAELAILVAAISNRRGVSRAEMNASLVGIMRTDREAGRSFDVLLCRLNKKLPATIRIEPTYGDGEFSRHESGRVGARQASAYALNSERAFDHIMRMARPSTAQERAA